MDAERGPLKAERKADGNSMRRRGDVAAFKA